MDPHKITYYQYVKIVGNNVRQCFGHDLGHGHAIEAVEGSLGLLGRLLLTHLHRLRLAVL